MVDSKEGYRTAFKATSLFGGVQIIIIIIGIVRSKLVAIWLGPSGLGILSLFTTAIQLLFSISNLGLASSAVREISLNKNLNDNEYSLSVIIKSLNKWVYYTSVIGALLSIIFSKSLSLWTFDSDKYTWSFILLSVVVLLTGLYNGHYAVLQGVRNLSAMAKARVYGALYGTSLTLPLYYFFQEKGIVFGLIITALFTYLVSRYYVSKIHLHTIKISFKKAFYIGFPAVKLGIMMALSAIAVSIVEYVVKSFIIRNGGTLEVGLYQAGWTINAAYLGLVFTAMATDYFPRISQISNDNKELSKKVNEQAEIAILILGPMIVIMLVFLPFIINILYTDEFATIVPMTTWLLVGSLVKAGSWAISFIFLAKNDGKIFLFNEIGIKFITLPSYIIGYNIWGIDGIGYAFTFNYLLYFILVSGISFKKYQFKYSFVFYKVLAFQLLLTISVVIINTLLKESLFIVIACALILINFTFTYKALNRRLAISAYIKEKIFNGKA